MESLYLHTQRCGWRCALSFSPPSFIFSLRGPVLVLPPGIRWLQSSFINACPKAGRGFPLTGLIGLFVSRFEVEYSAN
jgi:hypothetical protein